MRKQRFNLCIAVSLLFLNSCTHRSNEKILDPKLGQLSLAEKGKALISAKGCIACHSIDGSRMVGPSYKGIYGTDVKLADGTTVKVDDSYIRESIENPMVKVVAGYAPAMPAYLGVVSPEEIVAITEYIKSLK